MRKLFARRNQAPQLDGAAILVDPPVITAGQSLSIHVSGFQEGNFVSIGVPWIGSPEVHSNLSYSRYVDASGEFMVQVPPDWTTLQLAPGIYQVISRFAATGADDTEPGPSGLFEVVEVPA